MKWLRWQALIAALSTFACTGLCHGAEAEIPSVRVKPKFRVLFNQDCTNFFDRGEHTKEAVQQMIDEVADGGADVFLVNPNAQLVNYPSKVWQTFWDGYKEGDRSFFGSIRGQRCCQTGTLGPINGEAGRRVRLSRYGLSALS